ncbi:MAG TPA: sulfurtransferase complex subunit TusB [Candidatus Lokiarchaeia archaeon]|nr:sulfurtransferase complex subunit TusB [Candidatus Lokiarchaeia archaeon]
MSTNLGCVYLFGFSLRQTRRLETLLPLIVAQRANDMEVCVVLLHDAVIGTTKIGVTPQSLQDLLALPTTVYVLAPDLEARGLDPNQLLDDIRSLQYDDLVDLLAEVPKVFSWA